MKPKGVTCTQVKALDEYFLMVVSTLLNRVHVFLNILFNLDREIWQ